MELVTKTIEYQRLSARYTSVREENTDGIVPDSQPDIARIVDVSVMVFTRDREVSQDSINLRCNGKAEILYAADESDELYYMEIPLSFNHRVETRGVGLEDNIQVHTCVQSVDAHMINTRKVSVRVNTLFEICVYKTTSEEVTEGLKDRNGWCEKTKILDVTNTRAITSKNFTLAEDLTLDGEPSIKFITGSDLQLNAVETRINNNRIFVKAEVVYNGLCISDDGTPFGLSKTFYINQSCDVTNADDENNAIVSFDLRSFEVIPASDVSGNERYLSINAGLTMNIEVMEKLEVSILDDIYGLKNECNFDKKELNFRKFNEYCISSAKGEITDNNSDCADVLYAKYCTEHELNPEQGENIYPINGYIRYIYANHNGEIFSKQIKADTKVEINTPFSFASICPEIVTWKVNGDNISFEFGAKLLVTDNSAITSGCIASVEAGDVYAQDSYSELSAVIRRTASNENLWDIAKTYRTTAQAIAEANEIDADALIEENTLLMIPINRM